MPLLRESMASARPMSTILVSVRLRNNLEWMRILRLKLQTPIVDHYSSRDKELDREDGSQLLALEGKLDALMNLVTQLAANQKPASIARISTTAETRHLIEKMAPSSWPFSARNDAIVIGGVHDVATETSAETRKLESKLDALVNLVTQLASNQKPASVARVCGILDHHSSRDKELDIEDGSQLLALRIRSLPLLQETAASILPLTTIIVSVLLRSNLEWMSILRLMLQTPLADHHSNRDEPLDRDDGSQLLAVDALVNLVTQLAANQKPASISRVCGFHSSNDHHTSVCPSSQQSGFSPRNDVIIIRGVHDVATDTSAENRKLEGKLDALVNLVTQLAANQKPASIARVCNIRSSNDHHTSVCPSSQQSGVDEHP
ncbi:hypothetical protein Fmac_028578 [Flemingia macrophylla]|uniref:Uncharacterized protein n=1 Tax=Flemingia macrophylla TaxID=520843 RepID=A0ABD1L7W7_9FABA